MGFGVEESIPLNYYPKYSSNALILFCPDNNNVKQRNYILGKKKIASTLRLSCNIAKDHLRSIQKIHFKKKGSKVKSARGP